MRLDLGLFEHFQKWFRVLAIVIVHHDFARQFLVLRMLDERLGLLDHPSLVWLVGRRSEVNLPRFDVEKDQNKDISKSRFGNDLFREEITLPKGFSVSL